MEISKSIKRLLFANLQYAGSERGGIHTTSKNVKMGIKMKMKRGELMGFNGCLGYDYHPEDKTITVNEAEAETVRLIFELYLQGYGTYTIAKQ